MSWFKRTPHLKRVEKKAPYHYSPMSEKLIGQTEKKLKEKYYEEALKPDKNRRD